MVCMTTYLHPRSGDTIPTPVHKINYVFSFNTAVSHDPLLSSACSGDMRLFRCLLVPSLDCSPPAASTAGRSCAAWSTANLNYDKNCSDGEIVADESEVEIDLLEGLRRRATAARFLDGLVVLFKISSQGRGTRLALNTSYQIDNR